MKGSQKLNFILAVLLLFTVPVTGATENTIYISVESYNGKFENASYQLNHHQILFEKDVLFINNKKIIGISGNQLVELSLINSKLVVTLDGLTINFKNVN